MAASACGPSFEARPEEGRAPQDNGGGCGATERCVRLLAERHEGCRTAPGIRQRLTSALAALVMGANNKNQTTHSSREGTDAGREGCARARRADCCNRGAGDGGVRL